MLTSWQREGNCWRRFPTSPWWCECGGVRSQNNGSPGVNTGNAHRVQPVSFAGGVSVSEQAGVVVRVSQDPREQTDVEASTGVENYPGLPVVKL